MIMAIAIQSGIKAQNDLEVTSIRSPQFNATYDLDDSVNVEVSLKNNGPNVIIVGDYIHFDVKVSTADTTIFYNVIESAIVNLGVNNGQSFTLLRNLKLDSESNYQICASVNGTDLYPTNTSKVSGPCVSFVVGVEEQMIKANKVYFIDNRIRFELSQALPSTQYRILDLSGKVLKDGILDRVNQQEAIFKAPAKGLYFLQLRDLKGKQGTYKFIVR